MSTLKAFHCYNSGIQISGENKWIHFNFFKYFSPSCVSMRLSRHGKSTILLNCCEQYAFRFVKKEVSFAFLRVCKCITITFNFDTLHMLFFSEHTKEGSESDR